MNLPENDSNDMQDRPSRSAKKRESTALQKFAEKLTVLPPAVLASFRGMPEEVASAIADFQAMRNREARRRQLQYLGRLMRENDTEELRREYEAWAASAVHQRQEEALLTDMREKLIDGSMSVAAALTRLPHGEKSRLEALVRQAQNERAQSAPPRAARALFRYLRESC